MVCKIYLVKKNHFGIDTKIKNRFTCHALTETHVTVFLCSCLLLLMGNSDRVYLFQDPYPEKSWSAADLALAGGGLSIACCFRLTAWSVFLKASLPWGRFGAQSHLYKFVLAVLILAEVAEVCTGVADEKLVCCFSVGIYLDKDVTWSSWILAVLDQLNPLCYVVAVLNRGLNLLDFFPLFFETNTFFKFMIWISTSFVFK